MITAKQVYKLLPPAKKMDVLSVKHQNTSDIIKQVLDQHKTNAKEAKKIAHLFDTGDKYGTCLNIWNFLKYQIPYKVEPSSKQTTKTISRIVYDAINGKGNDCKHYSGFTGAVLDALGYPFVYRFAGYSDFISTPTHVYCVSGDIVIDAVINAFDIEKPYKFKIDKKMSLYKLSGIENEAEIGGLGSFLKKVGKAVKSGVKSAGSAINDVAKSVKQGALTVSLSIPRNAFLLLLRNNVHGWATGLSRKNFNDLKFWKDFGGNRSDLQAAIKAGASKKRVLGIKDDEYLDVTIGEPVTFTAALASAAPIVIKVSSLLKDAEKISNQVEGIKSTVDKTTQAVNQAGSTFKSITGKSVSDILYKKDEGKSGDKNSLSESDFSKPTDAQAESVAKSVVKTGGIDNKMILIGGAALAAILLISKKK